MKQAGDAVVLLMKSKDGGGRRYWTVIERDRYYNKAYKIFHQSGLGIRGYDHIFSSKKLPAVIALFRLQGFTVEVEE